MKSERWWWLTAFCVASLIVHIAVGLNSRTFAMPFPPPKHAEIEVSLEPLEEPPPKPEPKPEQPEPPKPEPQAKPEPKKDPGPRRPQKVLVKRPVEQAKPEEQTGPQRLVRAIEPRPVAPKAEPGGVDTSLVPEPLPLGVPSARRDTAAPRLTRVAKADPVLGGGGSPAPGPVLGGRGGAPGPEAPPEDILFNGGGRGGINLPREAPRIGGGGGQSVLSVENPLARDAVPEDRPGLGPGLRGGQGAGAGGGVGFGRGAGIGTRPDGRQALATLRAKPGPGIGAGEGSGIGTKPPGGGRGTGAELPGTGGSGTGYGRGSGIGIGNGRGAGIGDGGGAPRRTALNRGIPFGDVTGLLIDGNPRGGGGTGGGPGGPGRGAVFGTKPAQDAGGAPVHIVYVLDVSGSMRIGNKFGQAKAALKKALSELKPTDSFNLIYFAGNIYPFAASMLSATPANVQLAMENVESAELRGGTNISDALESALNFTTATHIFLLSDGEPSRGITDPRALRFVVRQRNSHKARIITLALGLGEDFPGIPLLKGLAEDNEGQFSYVNLAR
jgi:Mg-chelatase subunit ChlD